MLLLERVAYGVGHGRQFIDAMAECVDIEHRTSADHGDPFLREHTARQRKSIAFELGRAVIGIERQHVDEMVGHA